jgi:hypothetical protein
VLDVSSAGRAQQPKAKTINVEANLMAQRLIERRSLMEATRRRAFGLAAVIVIGVLTLPFIVTWMNSSNQKASWAGQREAELRIRLADLQKQQDTARPAIQESQLIEVVKSRSNSYLGRLAQFLNCVEPDMAINTLKVEVIAGDMKMQAQAEAESYDAYKKFVARCQEASGKDNVFPRSVKSSTRLGPQGVVFDIENKARVGQ